MDIWKSHPTKIKRLNFSEEGNTAVARESIKEISCNEVHG